MTRSASSPPAPEVAVYTMDPVTVDRPRTDPTERSIPATRITKSWPMASTARTEVWTTTLEMFAPVRNTGLRSVMARTRSSRMMAGPNLMIDKLRRMDLSVAPPTWLPVILSIKALISLPSCGEGHARFPCRPSRNPGTHRLRRCYWSVHPASTDSVEKMLRWSEANWFVFLMLLLIALPITLSTFEEESGWRGYLLFFLECLTPHVD